MKKLLFLAVFLMTLVAGQAFAQAPNCDALDEGARKTAQQAMDSIQSYGCCTDTVAACLKNTDHACRTPALLADEICRLAKKGNALKDIKDAAEKRKNAMDPSAKVYPIEVLPEHIWGNPEAKVILSVYLCGRCPYCSRHVPLLIKTLEQSPLKNKVAVNLRYFPIKAHTNSTPAALAIEASAQLGQAWPYLIKSYENFDAFSLAKISVWSQELGMDSEKFGALMKDPEVRASVAASKKEGLTNGVTTTHTFFLNGRRIEGTFDVDAIMSMLTEAVGE